MMPRPRREPTGLGLRPRPGGLGRRLRSLLSGGTASAEATWDELEEALIAADVGAETTLALVAATRAAIGRPRRRRPVPPWPTELRERLERVRLRPFELGPAPAVILVVGVNGSGKTTTIAKLAAGFARDGHSVVLAAADTFRAAAIEQLRLWGEQLGAAGHRAAAGRGSRGGRLRRHGRRRVARNRGGDRRHRRPAAEQGPADGRAGQDPPRHRAPAAGPAPPRAPGARRDDRARTASSRPRPSAARRASPGSC